MGLLDIYPIVNLRRNHGLEHATIHVLSERNPGLSLVGKSDMTGFSLYGAVDTAEVKHAVKEALRRLRAGQSDLAIHPRCGTILATTGVLTGFSVFLTLGLGAIPKKKFRWGAFPEAILAATLAALAAQPLGMFLQEHITVSGQPGRLEVRNITRSTKHRMMVHRVLTGQ
ncbi:MAG TPA: hypothetical protein ENK24_07145 [Anaerolineae bacterium]|nr:hypothetical protein [Anaerolineae bacterium]